MITKKDNTDNMCDGDECMTLILF